MSEDKAGKVPETKIAPPTTKKLTKSQEELYVTKRKEHNDGIQLIIDKYSKLSAEIFDKLLKVFAEELGVDIVGENWDFDHNTFQFAKKEKK